MSFSVKSFESERLILWRRRDSCGETPKIFNCPFQFDHHRKMLMSDYRLMPSVVIQCESEIDQFCDGGIEVHGKTIHCLMESARKTYKTVGKASGEFGEKCFKAIQKLLRVSCRVFPEIIPYLFIQFQFVSLFIYLFIHTIIIISEGFRNIVCIKFCHPKPSCL